jgi:hypothetical protein
MAIFKALQEIKTIQVNNDILKNNTYTHGQQDNPGVP